MAFLSLRMCDRGCRADGQGQCARRFALVRASGVSVCVGFGMSVRLCVRVCARECVLWVGRGTRTKPSAPPDGAILSEAFFSVVMPFPISPWIDASAEI